MLTYSLHIDVFMEVAFLFPEFLFPENIKESMHAFVGDGDVDSVRLVLVGEPAWCGVAESIYSYIVNIEGEVYTVLLLCHQSAFWKAVR